MNLTCPHCRRSLSSVDADGPPLFCMYCGHKLREGSAAPAAMETSPFTPSPEIEDDEVPLDSTRVPTLIGGYRLIRPLGTGGMGVVYEAEAPETGTRVAVKLLSPRLASSPVSVDRFKQEGRLASQLAHPRCVFVLSADTDGGRPYIVMELMPGQTLKDLVEKRGPLPPEEAIGYILDVIDGLAEAHRLGMIHRDMKPSNCFLTADERVKVGDFGLSKSLTDAKDPHLTQSGAFLGTVLFASPEQIRGEPLDYGSDVYSVCATLYFLLCGEAPYQHESLTAALAKAISEDPPSLRERRTGISRALEQVVVKGLERARDRRWQSLDDLRDALVNLLPSRRHPARPRALIGAYILDWIAISILSIPLNVLDKWLNNISDFQIELLVIDGVSVSILLLYFSLFDGIAGATPGKWLLGLHVSRMGHAIPPGIGRAFLRTGVFHLILFGVTSFPEHAVKFFGSTVGGVIGGISFFSAGAALLIQLRKKYGFRGVHDFVSDCHVTQKPLPARKLRLTIKLPTPLHSLLPPPNDALPATLGSYSVRGRIAVEASGEQVWLGQDGLLARLVLIWLRPVKLGPLPQSEASRPSRLRRLSGGALTWANTKYEWIAFAAPMGGPLQDAINPRYPLPWADTRSLLEQLVEEFRAAEADHSMPERLGLDQIWVEPNGRLQLLECSLAAREVRQPGNPISLLREVASLTLEGTARSNAGVVRAPIPPHAAPLLGRLFTDGGYRSVAELQQDLADTQNHRPEVTPSIRAAQLGIQVAIVGGPLAVMCLLTVLMGLFLTIDGIVRLEQANLALDALANPEKRAELAKHRELEEALKNPNAGRRLRGLRDELETEVQRRRGSLFSPQRLLLAQIEDTRTRDPRRSAGYPVEVRKTIQWAGAAEHSPRGKLTAPSDFAETSLLVVLLIIPVGLSIGAGVLRGGISFMLAGIALVRVDGRRATRRQCGLRSALVWLPVAALLYGSVGLQILAPDRFYLTTVLWLLAIVLLPVYFVIALRFPTRAPQDRLVGTYLMPA